MDYNLSDHFNEDGTVNADGPGLASLAGEEHAGTKCFDDIKDIQTFVKSHADTKSKLGKKLENVIQKPAADASDEDKAAYRASLKTELGAVKSGAEYEFTRPELPAGMRYDEVMEGHFRELFAQTGMPKDEARQIYDAYNKYQIGLYNDAAKEETRQIKTDDEQLRTDWPGAEMTVNTRMAFMAMQEIGAEAFPKLWKGWTEDDGTEIEGLEARLKKSGIFDSPGDLDKWRACGIDTSMLRLYCVLGKRMQAGKVLTGAGTVGGKTTGGKEITEAQQAEVDAVNAQTKWE